MRERVEQLVGAVARHVGDDVPRRLRPHPAARGRPPRLPLELHDLRPGRPGARRQGLPRGARPRPEALPAARHPLAHLLREEPPRLGGAVPREHRQLLRPGRGRRLRALRAAPARLQRDGLRRPAGAQRRPARELRRRARALAGRVQPPARRRVPGHEPRAVPHRAPALRRAPQRLRRRRRRPGDLHLARRRHPQHPRLRARLPGRARRAPGAELPLLAAHPRRRQRRHRAQRGTASRSGSGASSATASRSA